MIPDMLKQILSNQVVLAKEIVSLKQDIAEIKSTQEKILEKQATLESLIMRSQALLEQQARLVEAMAAKIEVKPQPTLEEIRKQIEIRENSLPRCNFGKM